MSEFTILDLGPDPRIFTGSTQIAPDQPARANLALMILSEFSLDLVFEAVLTCLFEGW